MDFKLPPRKIEDDDLLAGVKRRKLTSIKQNDAPEEEGVRKINLASVTGGVDTGIEEEEEEKNTETVPKDNTAGNKANLTTISTEAVSIRNGDWYYLRNGVHVGPNTLDDLKELYEMEASDVNEETLVWAKGVLSEWMPVKLVTELYAVLEDTEAFRAEEAARKEAAKAKTQEKKEAQKKQKTKGEAPKEWFELKVNTSIYVYNLPPGVTTEQLGEFFKKVGIIKIDPVSKKPKVKIYKDNDGLVTFMKPDSVKLAVDLLDGAVFDQKTNHKINVKPAEFKKKGDVYKPRTDLKTYEKEMKKLKKQQEQRLGWTETGSDPSARTLVIKNCFSPEDFRVELNLGERLKKSMQTAAGKHGPVEHVKVYPEHEDGVILVRFKSFISAQQCIEKLKTFNERDVATSWWDYKEKFDKQEDVSDTGRGFGVAGGSDDDSDDGFTY